MFIRNFSQSMLKIVQSYTRNGFRKIEKTAALRYSNKAPTENQLTEILRQKFPQAKDIIVSDISGGCGAMFEVAVESVEFKGLSIVKQHRLINEVLKEQIKDMHGLRIHTTIPK